MPSIELIIELVSWRLHPVENVEAPVDRMEVISVFISANVAHACLTTPTILESLNIWVLVLIVNTTSRNVARSRLSSFDWSFNLSFSSTEQVVCYSLHRLSTSSLLISKIFN